MTGQQNRGGMRPAHRCPWPSCRTPTRALMCRPHWYMMPITLRDRILATFRPGQTALTASAEYRQALRDVLVYAREAEAAAHGGPAPQEGRREPCPDKCGHSLNVHSADTGCWLCGCGYGRQPAEGGAR